MKLVLKQIIQVVLLNEQVVLKVIYLHTNTRFIDGIIGD